jgi:3-deoxy-D-manno-octulosonate 8-phosphate phosphatase (KDO 8-P phosphatase)
MTATTVGNQIKLIAIDVDGTLTDGRIEYDSAGVEHKRFHVADGLGIVMAIAAGIQIAIITGRSSEIVNRRMVELGVTEIVQGAGDKGDKLRRVIQAHGLKREEVAFIGDDINDLPAFEEAGLRIAVEDAAEIVIKHSDFVTARRGGCGAVREAIDIILKRQGMYDEAVKRYLEKTKSEPNKPAQ